MEHAGPVPAIDFTSLINRLTLFRIHVSDDGVTTCSSECFHLLGSFGSIICSSYPAPAELVVPLQQTRPSC
jgi:hypothetical protein